MLFWHKRVSKIQINFVKSEVPITSDILIKPVVIYGSETWNLRKIDKNALLVIERKVLRKIYGQWKDEYYR